MGWCPDIICHPGDVGTPERDKPSKQDYVGPLKSAASSAVNDIFGPIFNGIVNLFVNAPKQNIEWAIQAVTSTPLANLAERGYLPMYEQAYWLGMAAAIIGCIVALATIAIGRHRDEFVGRPPIAVFKVFLVGAVLPGLATTIEVGTQRISKPLVAMAKKTDWSKAKDDKSDIGTALDKLFVGGFTRFAQFLLNLEVIPIALSVSLTVLLGIVTYGLAVGKSKAGRPTQIVWSLLLTGLFLQPPLLFILAYGGRVATIVAGKSEATLRYCVCIVIVVAVLAPFLLIYRTARSFVSAQVENSNFGVHGRVRTSPDTSVATIQAAQRRNLDKRVDAMGAGRKAGKLVTGGALLLAGAALEGPVGRAVGRMDQKRHGARAQALSHGFTAAFNKHTPGGASMRHANPQFVPQPPLPAPATQLPPPPRATRIIRAPKGDGRWFRQPADKVVKISPKKRRSN